MGDLQGARLTCARLINGSITISCFFVMRRMTKSQKQKKTTTTTPMSGSRSTGTVMKMPHTPGPWTFDDKSTEVEINGIDGSMVASCFTGDCYGQLNWERMTANARLISAAPELINAANVALAVIAKQYVTKDGLEAAMMLREAIAKATGEA